ncbi:hypothetical protein KVR01_012316 [Diaporthe batatas]|uniref:uncharacterized protein n=1 Tax=Diaporthe batatas TaxID=748121 RepID=UPI001D04B05A|nr:uncharacterized protein KVR01_012316 [Diaporthe batatas]KAG8157654.1 hypothetical protein KVR01_012316 [Diaporthe batatas]
MERLHSRDIRSPAARAAMDTTMATGSVPSSDSLLRRGISIARSVLVARKDCVDNDQVNTCEKPSISTDSKIGIGAAIGAVFLMAVIGILFMLHLRAQRNAKAEFANDDHDASDYGLDVMPSKQGAKSGNLNSSHAQANRLATQQLVEADNPFGAGAERTDINKLQGKGSPPKYPDAVKM